MLPRLSVWSSLEIGLGGGCALEQPLARGNGYRSITHRNATHIAINNFSYPIRDYLCRLFKYFWIVIINNVSYDATCGACYCPFCLNFCPFLFLECISQRWENDQKTPITERMKKKKVIFGFSRGRNRSEAYQSEHMYSMRHKVNNQRLFILLFYPKQLQFLLVFMVFSLLNRSFLSFCLSHSLWLLGFGAVRPRWLAGWLLKKSHTNATYIHTCRRVREQPRKGG